MLARAYKVLPSEDNVEGVVELLNMDNAAGIEMILEKPVLLFEEDSSRLEIVGGDDGDIEKLVTLCKIFLVKLPD